MMLKNKVAVLYRGSGAVGSAISRAFAREGARVFLTGRNISKVDAVVKGILDAGGRAERAVAIFDGLENKEEDIFPDPASQSIAEGWRTGVAKAFERQYAGFVPESVVL